jgi:hypothetical protein
LVGRALARPRKDPHARTGTSLASLARLARLRTVLVQKRLGGGHVPSTGKYSVFTSGVLGFTSDQYHFDVPVSTSIHTGTRERHTDSVQVQ